MPGNPLHTPPTVTWPGDADRGDGRTEAGAVPSRGARARASREGSRWACGVAGRPAAGRRRAHGGHGADPGAARPPVLPHRRQRRAVPAQLVPPGRAAALRAVPAARPHAVGRRQHRRGGALRHLEPGAAGDHGLRLARPEPRRRLRRRQGLLPGPARAGRLRPRPRVRRDARVRRRRRRHRPVRRRDALLRRRLLGVRAHGLRVRALVLVDAAPQRPRRAQPARPVRRRLPRDDRGQPVRRARLVPGGGRSGRRVRVEQAVGAGASHAARRDRRRSRRPADLPAAGAHPVRHLPERLEDRQQRADGARAGRPPQRVHAQLRRVGGRLRAPVPDRPGDLPGVVRAPAAALAALPRDRRRPRVADGRPRVRGDRPGLLGRPVRGLDVPLAAAGGALLRAADGDPAGDRARAGPGGRPPAAPRGRGPCC